MAKASTRSRVLGTGCAILFSLPFVLVGIGMTIFLTVVAARHTAIQSWIEVPATIKRVELERGHGKKGKSYKAIAEYDYAFKGNQFHGDRVGFYQGTDNFGNFQQKAYQVLKEHLDAGKPFRCFVDPSEPSVSILFRELRWELMAFITIFPAAFGAMGLGMLTGALIAARRTPKVDPASVPADEPWRERADWASGRILARGAAYAVPVLAVITLWWMIATAPLLLKLPEMLQASDSPWRWLTLLFPIIGGLLSLALAYQYLRRRKYGESVLQLATTPGVVGGQLAGVVQIPKLIQPGDGFRLRLSCVQTTTGRDNKSQENVLWQDERLVTEPMRDMAAGTTALPVLFAIPFEAKETSRAGSNRDIRWQLDASANMLGVNYYSGFEVPVFKTGESRADFKLDESLLADYITAPPHDIVFREAGIVKESLPGDGVRLVFPAARNLGSALAGTAFLTIWTAAIWFMLRIGVPILFPIIFGLFELVILWIVVEMWLYRSVVEANDDGLTFRGGLFGIGRKRTWTADEVKRFKMSESMSSGKNVWKNVVVVLKNSKDRTIAKTIPGKLAPQAVIDELNAALGRAEK